MNSRGEFNRSYIPRLQVVEEEPEGAVQARMEDNRKKRTQLKEQDIAWERSKVTELGAEAVLGPMVSPKKRSKEQEDGAGKAKMSRKEWKHEVLEEGWGEQPLEAGAVTNTAREPQDVEGSRTSEEQMMIQGAGQYNTATREPQITPTRILLPPREQNLTQLTIAGFFKPATNEGWPTTQNEVTINDETSSTNRSFDGRFLC